MSEPVTYLEAILEGHRCQRPIDCDLNGEPGGPSMPVCGAPTVELARFCPDCRSRLLIPVKPIVGRKGRVPKAWTALNL